MGMELDWFNQSELRHVLNASIMLKNSQTYFKNLGVRAPQNNWSKLCMKSLTNFHFLYLNELAQSILFLCHIED